MAKNLERENSGREAAAQYTHIHTHTHVSVSLPRGGRSQLDG